MKRFSILLFILFILFAGLMNYSTAGIAEEQQFIQSGLDYYHAATADFNSKKYVDSMKNFNKAIAIEPNNYEYYYMRGKLRCQAFKDFCGAVSDYKKVVELYPEYEGIYAELAYVSLFNKNLTDAIIYLELAEQKNPDDAKIYITKALIKIQQMDYKGAIAEYDRAIYLYPNDSELYLRRGYAKAYIRKYRSAMDDYNKAIELDPKNYNAYEKRAEIHNTMLRSGKAKKDLIKSEQIRLSE